MVKKKVNIKNGLKECEITEMCRTIAIIRKYYLFSVILYYLFSKLKKETKNKTDKKVYDEGLKLLDGIMRMKV